MKRTGKSRGGKAQWGKRLPTFRNYRVPEGGTVITDELVRSLAKIAGITANGRKITRLQEELENIANGARYLAYQHEAQVRLVNQRAALVTLERLSSDLAEYVDKADLHSHRAILDNYPNIRLPLEPDEQMDSLRLFERDCGSLERLREGIKRGLEAVEGARAVATGGAPGKSYLVVPACYAADLYEELSGREFRYDRQAGTGDTDEFLTDGSRFVATMMHAIFPDATMSNLATTMRKVPKSKE